MHFLSHGSVVFAFCLRDGLSLKHMMEDDGFSAAAYAHVKALRRITLRIVPVLFLATFFLYLDRAFVSFAAIQMNVDLDMSPVAYGVGVSLFYGVYAVAGVLLSPLIRIAGASIGIGAMLILWGVIANVQIFMATLGAFYGLRAALGLAESPFFPAMTYYLSLWFSENDMAFSYVLVSCATAISGVLGGPIASLVMKNLDAVAMSGWRWLFVVEGVPAIALGMAAFVLLPRSPNSASFLDNSSRDWLVTRQQREHARREARAGAVSVLAALRQPATWILTGLWFVFQVVLQALIFYLPLTMAAAAGDDPADRGGFAAGVFATIPYLCAAVSMLVVAWLSDKYRERRLTMSLCALAGCLGLIISAICLAAIPAGIARLACVIVFASLALAGLWSIAGPFWAIPAAILPDTTAAVGFALIHSLGQLGGVAGPTIMGAVSDAVGNYAVGLGLLAICMALLAVLSFILVPRLLPARSPSDFVEDFENDYGLVGFSAHPESNASSAIAPAFADDSVSAAADAGGRHISSKTGGFLRSSGGIMGRSGSGGTGERFAHATAPVIGGGGGVIPSGLTAGGQPLGDLSDGNTDEEDQHMSSLAQSRSTLGKTRRFASQPQRAVSSAGSRPSSQVVQPPITPPLPLGSGSNSAEARSRKDSLATGGSIVGSATETAEALAVAPGSTASSAPLGFGGLPPPPPPRSTMTPASTITATTVTNVSRQPSSVQKQRQEGSLFPVSFSEQVDSEEAVIMGGKRAGGVADDSVYALSEDSSEEIDVLPVRKR